MIGACCCKLDQISGWHPDGSLGNTSWHHSNVRMIQTEGSQGLFFFKKKRLSLRFFLNLMKLDTWKKIAHNTLSLIPEQGMLWGGTPAFEFLLLYKVLLSKIYLNLIIHDSCRNFEPSYMLITLGMISYVLSVSIRWYWLGWMDKDIHYTDVISKVIQQAYMTWPICLWKKESAQWERNDANVLLLVFAIQHKLWAW